MLAHVTDSACGRLSPSLGAQRPGRASWGAGTVEGHWAILGESDSGFGGHSPTTTKVT